MQSVVPSSTVLRAVRLPAALHRHITERHTLSRKMDCLAYKGAAVQRICKGQCVEQGIAGAGNWKSNQTLTIFRREKPLLWKKSALAGSRVMAWLKSMMAPS